MIIDQHPSIAAMLWQCLLNACSCEPTIMLPTIREVAMTNEFYRLTVNGIDHEVRDAWAGESLMYVLRERLGLPGTKGACEQGECGSCTVLMDGEAVCSCLFMSATAFETHFVTVEGLSNDPTHSTPTDVQQAFIDAGGVQCGFCTPGLVVAVHHLLDRNPQPTELQIKEAISGNICRCTGYGRIFAAIELARDQRNTPPEQPAH
jgi:carbon-monoxide dehydrogenase small subunit